MARWTEDRERGPGEHERYREDERRWRDREGWRGGEWREDERGDESRAGDPGEWEGGAREWEARERERDRGRWSESGERRTPHERRGPYGERGGFGPPAWRGEEDRYGGGRRATYGPGGMYGGPGGMYGERGSVYGSGLGPYERHGRPGRYGGGRFDEGESRFVRDLRRYGEEGEDRGTLERMGDRMKEGWRKITGRGPKGYKRSDERIRDDVAERIARSGVNAEDVELAVDKGEVTLTGYVDHRADKRMVEDLAEDVFGVEEVQNHLRIRREGREQDPPGVRH